MESSWNSLLAHLMRGGSYGHYWISGTRKYTHWWEANAPSIVPTDGDIYFGVNPVTHIPTHNSLGQPTAPEYVRSRIAIIEAINCLYAEYDGKDYNDSKSEAREAIAMLDPAPSVIVDSGGGYHAYWLLDQPFRLDTEEARTAAKHYQAEWVNLVHGDEAAHDIARVLRVPGTVNRKQKYAPDFPLVRIIEYNDSLYSLSDLTRFLPPIPEPDTVEYEPIEIDGLQDGRYWLNKYVQQAGGRHQRGLLLAGQLRDNNFSQAEAEAVMLEFASIVRNEKKEPYTSQEALTTLRWAWAQPKRRPVEHQKFPATTRKAALYFIAQTTEQPEPEFQPTRGFVEVEEPKQYDESVAIDDARLQMERAIVRYLSEPQPDYMLLIKSPPGAGKTHAVVRVIQELVKDSRHRVLYAAPRHDMFQSISAMPHFEPDLWYEWLPRQEGDFDNSKEMTCLHVPQISTWMGKGHKAMDFCKMVCGWSYINEGCNYHAQRHVSAPIIFGQHAHPFLGHKLDFNVLIGDEYPISAALREWRIPTKGICPEYDPFDPPNPILIKLQQVAMKGERLEGVALLDALGGAEYVLEQLGQITIPELDKMMSPEIHMPEQAEAVPYGHFWELIRLLRKEAEFAKEGTAYLTRVILDKGELILLLRRSLNSEMPRHIIWLDATAIDSIYESVFERPAKIIAPKVPRLGTVRQVVDRANGKTALANDLTQKQTKYLVDKIVSQYGYRRVGVFTFKNVEPIFSEYETGHFGAETGSNAFEGVDALFVVGTPLPQLLDIQAIAKMVYFERMTPFNGGWYYKDAVYEGHGLAYPIGGYWNDPDLNALVQQVRESKLIQAAERGRTNVRKCDVWLLSNIPISGYPPDELLSIRQILRVPGGVDMWNWEKVIGACEAIWCEKQIVTADDLIEVLGLSRKTAVKYMEALVNFGGWERVEGIAKRKGRPAKMVRKTSRLNYPAI